VKRKAWYFIKVFLENYLYDATSLNFCLISVYESLLSLLPNSIKLFSKRLIVGTITK
jgi:hypothetical protein